MIWRFIFSQDRAESRKIILKDYRLGDIRESLYAIVGVGKRGERKFSDYAAIRDAAKARTEVAA